MERVRINVEFDSKKSDSDDTPLLRNKQHAATEQLCAEQETDYILKFLSHLSMKYISFRSLG